MLATLRATLRRQDPPPHGTPVASGPGRGRIGRKVLALAGAWVTAGFAALLVLQAQGQHATRESDMRASGQAVARLVASQAAGGVKWGKPKAIEAAYADLAADPGSDLVAVAVFDAAGKPLTRHHRAADGPEPDLGALLPEAEAELAAGRVFERRVEGDRLAMLAPVLSGENRQRVGTLALAWSTARLEAEIRSQALLQAGLAAAVLAALLGSLAVSLGRAVFRPLGAMTAAMSRLAAGDTGVDVPARGRRDEIGAMADAVQVFKDNAIRGERLAAERDRAAAREALIGRFEEATSAVVDALASAAGELEASLRGMAGQAGATSASVEAAAAVSEQMAAAAVEIGRQVSASTGAAAGAAECAGRGDAQTRALAEAASRIGEVVGSIAAIAGRTNLLALNATIEAARAGEAGRGFAVVAQEVKTLAEQTRRATDEIGAKVAEIQACTGRSVEAFREVVRATGEVSGTAAAIVAAVDEQGAATSEIARNLQSAAAGARDVARSNDGLTRAADDVARQAGTLRDAVAGFLGQIRAA